MINCFILISNVLILLNKFNSINAHGRLVVPPARSSAWREDNKRFPVYYDDNQMYCGGSFVQSNNGGRCGICGENINSNKRFEKGGSLYTGISVRNYTKGQLIDVHVYLSANHLGWTEFRICNVDNMVTDATQECLDKVLLKDLEGNTRIKIHPNVNNFKTQLQLPKDLLCNHCVFQWKYHAGNSWNIDSKTGKSCLGCGPQEEFYGCADVSIFDATSINIQTVTSKSISQTTTTTEIISETTTTTSIIETTTLPNTIITKLTDSSSEKSSNSLTYGYSKKVIYNPIANKIEVILYKNSANSIDQITKRFEIIPYTKTQKLDLDTETQITTTTTIPIDLITTTTPSIQASVIVKELNQEELCHHGDGYYADVNTNCKEYYVCLFVGTPVSRIIRLKCPGDLYFEPTLKICIQKDSVLCDKKII